MIQYLSGDIFQSTMQTLVNPVNTVGVMGSGLACEFSRRYPEMLNVYKQHCQDGSFKMGTLWIYRAFDKWILNFPTKKHWRDPSELIYIEAGLTTFVRTYEVRGITSIAFPKLGCGLGKLGWPPVRILFEKYLGSIEIPIEVYAYGSIASSEKVPW